MKRIFDFSIEFSKKRTRNRIYIDHNPLGQKDLHKNEKFIIGYKNKYRLDSDEKIILIISKNRISIQNDYFSSYPVYIFEDRNKILISNTIEGLNQFEILNLEISSDLIYTYFTFGYIPFENSTIYKNVTLMPPNSSIDIEKTFILKEKPINIFDHQKEKVYIDKLFNNLNDSAVGKLKDFEFQKSLFCLTSGQDSLLGALLLKKHGFKISTGTYGSSKNAKDIIIAKQRSEKLKLGAKHNEAIFEDFIFEDLIKLSTVTGGLSTSSNIFLFLFVSAMRKRNYKYFFYCDHYEVFRRSLENVSSSITSSTTPYPVVEKYFKNVKLYKKSVNESLEGLSIYKFDPYMSFYLFDKYIKATFYKNLIHNAFSTTKITLPLDYKLLRFNNNYIRNTKAYSFKSLSDKLKNDVLQDFEFDENKEKVVADFPFHPFALLKHFKNEVFEIISYEAGKELNNFFNLDLILESLESKNHVPKEEWFILRLLNLIIYKQKRKTGVY